MSDPFDPANASFTPRNPQASAATSPWTNKYTMQHRLFSTSAGSFDSNSSHGGWMQQGFVPATPSGFLSERTKTTSKDQHESSTPIKLPIATAKGVAGVPGILPDESQNDTFVMDLDNGPEEIISELKLQIESLITAIVLASSGGSGGMSSALQGADGVQVAHRIMNRLKVLRQENEQLGKLTSGTHAAELEAKVHVLERENALLKQQLNRLQLDKGSSGRFQ